MYGRQLQIKTDSNVLRWLYDKKDLSGKFARWVLALQEYSLSISHLKGNQNAVADALSRAPVGLPEETQDCVIGALLPSGYSPVQIEIMQKADPDTRQLTLDVSQSEKPVFIQFRGVWYRRNDRRGRPYLLIVPSILRKDIVAECHDSPNGGHHGVKKTFDRVIQRYWWKGVEKSVAAYVSSCPFCQSFKSRVGLKAGKLRPIAPPKEPFELLGIDHLGPFKTTQRGMQHLVVCIDYATRWLEVAAVPTTASEHVESFLEKSIFCRHGTPRRLISDRGSAFTSESFAWFLERWRVKHVLASAEHPETNGMVERVNRTLSSTLAAFVNLRHNNWDELLDGAVFSINTATQGTVGISPFELLYGRTPVLPHEAAFPWPPAEREEDGVRICRVKMWRKVARILTVRRQKVSKRSYDRNRRPDPVFQPGELVMVSRKPRALGKTKKFMPKFVGPYLVERRVAPTCYCVQDLVSNRSRRIWRRFNVHSSQMRRYSPRAETDWIPEDDETESIVTLESEENEPEKDWPDAGEATDLEMELEIEEPPPAAEDETQLNVDLPTVTRRGRTVRKPAAHRDFVPF